LDWNDAFDNSSYVAGSEDLPDQWAKQALKMRTDLVAQNRAQLDQPYGATRRETSDLFLPDGMLTKEVLS
jgi:hypothetical protein